MGHIVTPKQSSLGATTVDGVRRDPLTVVGQTASYTPPLGYPRAKVARRLDRLGFDDRSHDSPASCANMHIL